MTTRTQFIFRETATCWTSASYSYNTPSNDENRFVVNEVIVFKFNTSIKSDLSEERKYFCLFIFYFLFMSRGYKCVFFGGGGRELSGVSCGSENY